MTLKRCLTVAQLFLQLCLSSLTSMICMVKLLTPSIISNLKFLTFTVWLQKQRYMFHDISIPLFSHKNWKIYHPPFPKPPLILPELLLLYPYSHKYSPSLLPNNCWLCLLKGVFINPALVEPFGLTLIEVIFRADIRHLKGLNPIILIWCMLEKYTRFLPY